MRIVQENGPGIPAQLQSAAQGNRVRAISALSGGLSPTSAAASTRCVRSEPNPRGPCDARCGMLYLQSAYFGGVVLSDGGGVVGLVLGGGVVWSEGGVVVVEPGAVD